MHCTAYGLLVLQPGNEPGPSAAKARSPNCWTSREFPIQQILSTYYVSSSVLGAGDPTVNKTDKNPCPCGDDTVRDHICIFRI